MLRYITGEAPTRTIRPQRPEPTGEPQTRRAATMQVHDTGMVSDRKLRLLACACCRAIRHFDHMWGPDNGWRQIEEGRQYRTDPDNWPATRGAFLFLEELPPGSAAALLREIVGNPFRPVKVGNVIIDGLKKGGGPATWIDPDCITPTVLALAEAAHEERPGRKCERCKGEKCIAETRQTWAGLRECPDCHGIGTVADGSLCPDRLAVLADALEESGCCDADLLMHLRGVEPCPTCTPTAIDLYDCPHCQGTLTRQVRHVRGCWALDVVLGKS